MTFLAPAALLGLVLLAIPVIVHLFRPRRVRQTPFSSLRWLHLTQQRMARRIQWHQVLLFLLRAAFLTLLVLALSRPLFTLGGSAVGLDRVLLLDTSASMGRRAEGRPRPLDAARELAATMLRRMQPGDRAAVLVCGANTTVLAPWTTDAAPYLPVLDAVQAGPTATNLDSALDVLRSLLDQRRPGADVEICILTDNTSGSWSPGAIASFVADLPADVPAKGEVSLRLVDLGLAAPANGWLAAARLRETEAGPALRLEAWCVGPAPQSRSLHVAGLAGVEELTQGITLEPGRPTAVDLPLPAGLDRSQSRVRLWLEPADELPEDDELFLDLDTAGAARLLLIEPESPADESQRPGFPLRTAFQALAETGGAAADYQLLVRSPAAVTPTEIAAADIVLLADIPGLSALQAEALTRAVREGAGAALFLGPGVQADVYQQRFLDPLRPAEGLLPAPLGNVVQVPASAGGLAAWGHWNARHPLVAGLLDPLLGDLPLIRSRAYFQWNGPVPAADEVVATFEDGTPALIARRLGAGRVVLFNTSADDRWCDLPRRKSYVPLVDRLLTHLATSARWRTFTCGEPVTLQLPPGHEGPVVVQTPSGKTFSPRVDVEGAGALLRWDAAMETGFHRVVAAPNQDGTPSLPPLTFTVQPSHADSSLERLDPDTLRSWWLPARLELIKPADFRSGLDDAAGRVALEPWLALVAGLVFLAEMFLVHWLCPRVSPALAATPVRRRGFVAPLRDREGAQP